MWLLKRCTLLFALLAAGACGFTPVYSTGGSGTTLQDRVEVSEPETRNEFLLTQRLEERLGRTPTPAYRLTVEVSSEEEDIAVDSEGITTRFNLIGAADYILVEEETGRVVTSGKVNNFTSYSASGTTVSELAAERDARKRLMILLADQIVIRLLSADLS